MLLSLMDDLTHRKMTFQPTTLPAMPGIVSRPTPIPTVGNLQDVYPETFGGVSGR